MAKISGPKLAGMLANIAADAAMFMKSMGLGPDTTVINIGISTAMTVFEFHKENNDKSFIRMVDSFFDSIERHRSVDAAIAAAPNNDSFSVEISIEDEVKKLPDIADFMAGMMSSVKDAYPEYAHMLSVIDAIFLAAYVSLLTRAMNNADGKDYVPIASMFVTHSLLMWTLSHMVMGASADPEGFQKAVQETMDRINSIDGTDDALRKLFGVG